MAETTRLDRLWPAAMAAGLEGAPWAAFCDALATERLVLALDAAAVDTLTPTVLETGAGPLALVFDREARLSAAVSRATERAHLDGRTLLPMLADAGLGLALNPGAGASETVLAPAQVAWIAETFCRAPEAAEEAAPLGPPPPPAPGLLETLGARLADFGAEHVAEAWLAGLGEGHVLLLAPADGLPGDIAGEMAAALARLGQAASPDPFAAALAAPGSARLETARRLGIAIRIGPETA